MSIPPKKQLGQHFVHDARIAAKVANYLKTSGCDKIVEVGPGTGELTRQLLEIHKLPLLAVEVDERSVTYLAENLAHERLQVLQRSFLDMSLDEIGVGQLAVVGNFPYNISSQILFKVLEWRERVPEMVGMFQKEVAQRICAPPGSKTYGILSVLVQAFYETDYVFTIAPGAFRPPPKVQSAVIRLQRRDNYRLDCDESLFFRLVKQAFQMRRKTLRNALKSLNLPSALSADPLLSQRAEQLSVEDFVYLTRCWANNH